MKITVVGASGLIGTKVVGALEAEDTTSSRHPARPAWTS